LAWHPTTFYAVEPEQMSEKDVLVQIWRTLQAIKLLLIGFALAGAVAVLVVVSLSS
jgi:hypothetical protein